jgi:hypothetical protein
MLDSKLGRALRALVKLYTEPFRYHAAVRYRVVSQVAERFHLQALRKGVWPDTALASVMPGASGYEAHPTPGSLVLVQFIEGDPALPIITHFAGPDGESFIPISVSIAGADRAVALVGSIVRVSMPPVMPVTGTVTLPAGPMPFTGVVTIPGTMLGIVVTGSSKVKVGA